jgi:hypothetical protein
MTRTEAVDLVHDLLNDWLTNLDEGGTTDELAENIVNKLPLALEPSIVELSATLHGVGKLSHGK